MDGFVPAILASGDLIGQTAPEILDILGIGAGDDVTFDSVSVAEITSGTGEVKYPVGVGATFYKLDTDVDNYEAGVFRWSGNNLQIGTIDAGAGGSRDLYFIRGNSVRWMITGSENRSYLSINPNADSTLNLGTAVARWADVYATQYRNNGTDPAVFPEGLNLPESKITFEHDSGDKDLLVSNRELGSGSKISTNGSYGQGFIFDLDFDGLSAYESFRIRFNSDENDVPFHINRWQQTTLGRVENNSLARLNVVGSARLEDGTTGCSLFAFNTYTDASNNEYLEAGWDSNIAYLRTVAAGTGTVRNLYLSAGNSEIRIKDQSDIEFFRNGSMSLELKSNGVFFYNNLITDNGSNIGNSVAQPANAYIAQYRNNGTDPAYFPEGAKIASNTSYYAVDGSGSQRSLINFNSSNILTIGYSNCSDVRITQRTDINTNIQLSSGLEGIWLVPGGGVVHQRNGTNEQRTRIYNTYTDDSNNEYLELGYDANIAYLRTVENGTGTPRDFYLQFNEAFRLRQGMANRLIVDSVVRFYSDGRPSASGAYNMGQSGAYFNAMFAESYRFDGTNAPKFPEGLDLPVDGELTLFNSYTDASNNSGMRFYGTGSEVKLQAFQNGATGFPRITFSQVGSIYFFLQNAKAEWYVNQVPVTDTYGDIGLGTITERWNRVCAVDFQNNGTDPINLPEGAKFDVGSALTIYNLDTDASNYERLRGYWSSNVFYLATEAAGTGTQRGITIDSGDSGTSTLYGAINVIDGYQSDRMLSIKWRGSSRFRFDNDTFSKDGALNTISLGTTSVPWNGVYSTAYHNDGTDPINLPEGAKFDVGAGATFYNLDTDASNNEYLEIAWDTNTAYLRTVANGTGTPRKMILEADNMELWTDGNRRIDIGTTINLNSAAGNQRLVIEESYIKFWRTMYSATDSAYDVGRGTYRFGNAYVSQYRNDGTAPVYCPEGVRIDTNPPASASDTGAAGTLAWDADYIYVCTATDTWKRAALSTW